MLQQSFIKEMESKLLEKQSQLLEDLKNLKPHEEIGNDQDASAQEVENDEVSRDVMATLESDLAKIGKALQKIKAGTYGTDDEGKEISEERLRVIPWADKAI